MKNNKIWTIAISSLLLFGCGNTASEKPSLPPTSAMQEEYHHDEESDAIALDNGQKWTVNTNMIVHIRNMEKDINTFALAQQKDYKSLSGKLQKNIDLLTANCTMEGKAHDELHKWLVPYIDMVSELSEAKDKTEAAKYFANIQNSFTTFNQYFQ